MSRYEVIEPQVEVEEAEFPYKLQPIFQSFRYKALHGGRGGGKTRGICSALLILGTQSRKRILCAREIQKSIEQSVKAELDEEIKRLGLGGFYVSNKNRIVGLNGTEFMFAGLYQNVDSIKSIANIDICWVEEAHSISKESLTKLTPSIRKTGSEIWFSWNRENESDPVDELFLGEHGAPPDSVVIEINYWDNPWFKDTALVDEMEFMKKHDIEAWMHIWAGGLRKISEANIIRKWRIDADIVPTEDDILYYGADWGFASDPNTLVRAWVNDEKREIYVDYEGYGLHVENEDIARKIFDPVPGSDRYKIYADNARPETISYMCRQKSKNGKRFKVLPCKKGQGSVEDGVTFLQSYTIVVHPRCKHLIQELKFYKYKVDKKTEEVLPDIVDKHNHCIDALRYALEKLAFAKRFSFHIG